MKIRVKINEVIFRQALRLGIGLGYLPNFLLKEDMTILDDQLSEGFR
jgi:hypothetical protein